MQGDNRKLCLMRAIFLFFILLLYSLNNGKGQDRPVFLPEDIDGSSLRLKCLCKPGVVNKSRSRGLELSFIHTNTSTLEEEEGYPLSQPLSRLRLQNFNFKLKIPVVNKEGFKLILGTFYRPEHYDFERIGVDYAQVFNRINGRNLKSTGFDGLLVKSLSETMYGSFRLRTMYNGDYSGLINFDNRYSVFNASMLLGFKKRAEKEMGVGITFSKSFRNTIVLPFFLYNHTFNGKWGIETVLPALASVRYNLTDRSIFLAGIRYNSRSYSVGTEESLSGIYNLNHSELRMGLSLEQNIHPWVWLDISAGFQYNFSTDFEAVGENISSFQVEPGSSPVFRIGIFISPPKS